MLEIRMKEQNRETGKTNNIKLSILEETHRKYYHYICVISFNEQSEKEYKKWVSSINLNNTNIVVGFNEIRQVLRMCDIDKLLVLVDEPFIMNEEKQSEVIEFLENYSTRLECIDVFGVGTRKEEKTTKLFKNYV